MTSVSTSRLEVSYKGSAFEPWMEMNNIKYPSDNVSGTVVGGSGVSVERRSEQHMA
jgi:hypothetical protein